ncbi:MAG TPA: M14 metallopeptidase family protein [Kofleriaceae bacterium]|nr:M14 metallopeptidase family protein [Kofleriaceae bacterium]
MLVLVIAAVVGEPRGDHADWRREDARRVAVELWPRSAAERAAIVEGAFDVWTDSAVDGESIVVAMRADALGALALRGVPMRVQVDDLDAVAAAERVRLARRVRDPQDRAAWFAEYRDLDEITAFEDRMVARRPEVVRTRELGRSIEDEPVRAIEISRGGSLRIVLNGGQHAREWISVMVATCVADRLADERDPRVRGVLDRVRFTIVPVANPDGYRYSWERDRYWRKNRRGGYGVDLNRNYSVAWGGRGSSGWRRSEMYRGEAPFSEPETRAMAAAFDGDPVAAHVDFHSYSQLVLYPWSHTATPPPDRDRFAAVADRMASALVAAHGKRYQIRAGSDLQVGASGTLPDWSYGERRALAFTIELRPARGPDGFVLPPEQIVPTCDESFAAVLELADQVIRAGAPTAPDRSSG